MLGILVVLLLSFTLSQHVFIAHFVHFLPYDVHFSLANGCFNPQNKHSDVLLFPLVFLCFCLIQFTVVEFNVDPCAVADSMARQVSTPSAKVNFLFF